MLYLLLFPALLSAPTSDAIVNYDTFSVSGMNCTIGNKSRRTPGRITVCFRWEGGRGQLLTYAGLNLEHYFVRSVPEIRKS